MRLVDADKLEPSEVYMNYGFTRIVYMDDIDEMPTVDPFEHGHWIYVGHGWAGESICKCSMCGHQTPDDGNYCSYCGAKMDEEKRENVQESD